MSSLVLDPTSLANLAQRFGAEAELASGRLSLRFGVVVLDLTRCELGGTVRVGGVAIALERTRLSEQGVEVDFAVDPVQPR